MGYLNALSDTCKAGLKTKLRLLPWGLVRRQWRSATRFFGVSAATDASCSTFDNLPAENTQLQKRQNTHTGPMRALTTNDTD